jgi:glycerol-3-phosphate acyltransferase PlsY
MTTFLLCVTAYMVGAIPFGLILTRLAGLGDIRAIGSGNIGATNVLRTGRKGLALATLLLDALKGTLAVDYTRLYTHGHGGVFAVSICVFLGHLYPVWLRFKGGKGVATALGVFYGVGWPLGIFCCGVWLAVALALRWSSLAALSAFALAPFAAWYFSGWKAALLALIIGAFVFWKHRANIQRLLAGTEPRIGQK